MDKLRIRKVLDVLKSDTQIKKDLDILATLCYYDLDIEYYSYLKGENDV